MGDSYKALAVEKNGVDLADAEEVALSAVNITFNNSSNGFTATEVQAAIEEAGIFGTRYQFEEAKAETSTTSTTTWANKLTLTTPSLPSGNYYVGFQLIWRSSSASREAEFRVQRGGVSLIEWEPSVSRTQDSRLECGFEKTGTISGVNTFTLDFRVGGSATTIFVREAHLVFWRLT